mmetsp:Transcript_12050/g.24621  ORF Transcript_12050/g.24621 Transcript_12050/m.24621 type:complete len:272 (+) Transcript_12050:40-855(+)
MPSNVAQFGDENPVKAWYSSLPPVTRIWWTLAFMFANLVYFGVLDVTYLIWDFGMVTKKFQLWRVVTSFCFVGTWGQSGFGTLISLYLLQQYGKSLENNAPNTGGGGTVADYMVLITFCMLIHILITIFFAPRFIMGSSLMFTTLYIWCKMNYETEVKLWGFPMKAAVFPFALMGLHLATGNDVWSDVYGLAVGHCYYFLQEVYPTMYGKDIIHTPNFVISLCHRLKIGGGYVNPNANSTAPRGVPPPGRVRPPTGGGYNWGGGGRTLGSS